MWTDQIEENVKAGDRSNVTEFFSFGRLMRDENVWLVISHQVSKYVNLEMWKGSPTVVCLSFTPPISLKTLWDLGHSTIYSDKVTKSPYHFCPQVAYNLVGRNIPAGD